ncbi:integrase [Pseudomonas trivialis]|uniref:Integrase n=1 Tax=Pseudomonas trivialis TaxID=200450 RepID=A0A0R2ZHL9_9PSED|nr:integrase [Pseudomonas trivialis]
MGPGSLIRITEENLKALVGHKNGSITSHYSGAELGHLIEAANMVQQPILANRS